MIFTYIYTYIHKYIHIVYIYIYTVVCVVSQNHNHQNQTWNDNIYVYIYIYIYIHTLACSYCQTSFRPVGNDQSRPLLQCVAVCCSVLQWCSASESLQSLSLLQCVAVSRQCIAQTLPMGWLRLVGALKLCVSFAEYSLFYRALLQKRPTIPRSLPIIATPQQLQTLLSLFATHCNIVCNTLQQRLARSTRD